MSIDYNDRGVFHKVVNHTPLKLNQSKNVLIRNSAKTLLKAEKVSLIAKDMVTNKLVGKEFHLNFERHQSSSGKFYTKVSLVRADAPAYKQRGVLHRLSNLSRRFEGDIPNTSKSANLRRTAFLGAKKVALSSETTVLTVSTVLQNRLRQNVRNNMDGIDTGKATLSAITAVRTINNARKIAIQHRLKKASFKIQKQKLSTDKVNLKKVKKNLKTSKKDNKLYLKRKTLQLQKIHKVYSNNKKVSGFSKLKRVIKINKKLNANIAYCEKKLNFEKHIHKNQKNAVKNAQKLKKYYRTKPLILTGIGGATAKTTGRLIENIAKSDSNNDFVTAISKSATAIRDVQSINRVVKNYRVSKTEKRAEKLNKRSNKLQQQKNKLHKKQKTKSKQVYNKNPKKEKNVVKEVVANFFKFILKFVCAIAFPLIIIIFLFAIVLLMFGGGAENNTYVLGTYNCNDYTMAQAIDAYTEIAYDFNQTVIECQQSSTWKSGLNSMGINTSSYTDTPTEYIFGNSSYFPYDAVYDFDYDKFIAFMCAYTYDFSTDNEDVELWTWKTEYEDVIQDLFDAEYEFKHKYINTSHWVTVNSYTAYPSANEFWYVDSTGITTVSGVQYGYLDFSSSGLPSELSSYTNDKSIHFDLSTGEIKNRKKAYGKTGMYIQNLNYEYTLPSGSKINSFYKNVISGSTGSTYTGFKIGDTWYHKTQLYVGSYMFNYAMAKEDVRLYVGNSSENRQLIRDFKQEEYVTECKLYTNVNRKRTFDEAIRLILNNSSYSSDRIEFYNTLLNADNIETYGNHQMYKASPLADDFSTLINQGKIYNGYGYDMQNWNSKHCGLFEHDGIDIEAAPGNTVYSMIDGKIEDINSANHTITVITTENLNYWYEDNNSRTTKIIYTNVTAKSGLQIGDTVNAGDYIGKVDTYSHCYDNIDNSAASKYYLHISVYIKYGVFSWDWHSVDPRFLIYLENQ